MARQRTDAQNRQARVPLGTPRRKLSVENQDPARVYRWVNDKHGRLEQAEAGGYRFEEKNPAMDVGSAGDAEVTGGEGIDSRISRIVGTAEDGSPMRAFLMSIDRDLYEADQNEKMAEIDRTEEALMRTATPEGAKDDTRYTPMKMTTPVRIQHERR